jgi:sulfur-oxidizing protein SoxY
VPVRVSVRHPNTTGLQLDPRGRAALPVSFLSRLEVRYRGAEVLRVEAETSVAEDPTFGFALSGEPGGELRGWAEDSDGRRFRGAGRSAPRGRGGTPRQVMGTATWAR